MNLLTIENLSKVFTERQVFDQADFSVNEGEKIGVIGVNGCGKSSLFRMLCHGVGLPGGTEPTAGEVYLAKGRTVGILTQEGAFAEDGEDGNGDQSALEHMYHAFPELLAAETRLDEMQKALDAGADYSKVIALPVRERIGRAKYIPEEEIREFDKIESELSEQMAALTEGGR